MNAITIEILESARVVAIEDRALVFGRSRSADVRILDDRLISSKHFQVSLDDGFPLLIDLGSTNGTILNGTQVHTARMNHGDVIEAGNTHFQVHAPLLPPPAPIDSTKNSDSQRINDEQGQPLVRESDGAQGSAVRSGRYSFNPFESYHGPRGKIVDDDVTLPASRLQIIEATQSLTESGLVRLEGRVEDASEIIDVLSRFVQFEGLYLLADFGRLGRSAPDGLDIEESCLFDWLPPSAAAQLPLLVPVDDDNDWKAIVEHGWGGDAIEVLHTSLEKAEFIQLLRKLLRGAASHDNQARGVSGFCWPSVLASMLENDTNSFAESFMKNVDFAIVESAEPPEGWQLYTDEETAKGIGALGFRMIDFSAGQTIQSEPATDI